MTLDGEDATVSADAELLRATILNLPLNAAQAMEGRGRIAITVDRRGDQWAIAIRDTGPGIPPELQQQVFEPFFTTKARGGGLGLAVARRTAEVHGGTLGMVCPEGGGTTMTLVLPVRAASDSGEAGPELECVSTGAIPVDHGDTVPPSRAADLED